MPKFIISYRRSDTDAMAGRIRDNLAVHYGDDAVFIDVDNIPLGVDFRDHIRNALAEHDLLIAVVGQKWLGRRKDGHTRIDDDTDPVRIEIEMALQRNMPIMPVLVNRANMPKPEDLPEPLKPFSYRNAAQIDSGRDFHQHMDRLIESMEQMLGVGHRAQVSARETQTVAGVARQPGARFVESATPVADVQHMPAIPIAWTIAVTYAALIAAHYSIVLRLDLRISTFRLASLAIPFIFGLLCRPSQKRPLGIAILIGLSIAFPAIITMLAIVSAMDKVSILPETSYEMWEVPMYAASIAFAFLTGAIVRQNLPAAAIRIILTWVIVLGSASIAFVAAFWEYLK